MKTTAGKLAIELRKLADSLDAQPAAEIVVPWMFFHDYEKESFVTIAKLLPRPLKKSVEDEGSKFSRLKVEYNTEAIQIKASVPQSVTCELIVPAKPAIYRCDPILSEEEEMQVGA